MELLFKKDVEFGQAYKITTSESTLHIMLNDEKEVYLEGNFFYKMNNGKADRFDQNRIEKQLHTALLEKSIKDFVETVEGTYAGVYIDKKAKKLVVFSDKLKRKEIFYCEDGNELAVSTSLMDLKKRANGRNQNALISAIYLYIPKKHTLFNNIFRLRYNEFIEMDNSAWAIKYYREEPLKIEKYTSEHINVFRQLLENAIVSRASDKLNVVQMSGGWDSSFLAATLVKHFGKDKIKGIVGELMLSDGRTYNRYEVEKAQKIAEFLGIELDVVKVDYGDPGLVALWKNIVKDKVLGSDIYHFSVFIQFAMAEHVKNKYGRETVVFNGECCDSIMNFGFAQFDSITHESKAFGEYSDKMLCYLYGPTFFKKVINGTYEEDTVFRIYKWYSKNFRFVETKKMEKQDILFNYLFSFVYGAKRVPFVTLDKLDIVSDQKIAEFKKWVQTEYFDEAVENITAENIYYEFLRLYVDFHLQGSTNIRKVTESLPNIRMPYLDYSLFKFFACMPENWGRGLDINNTKYPLKTIIYEGVKNGTFHYPLGIIEDAKIHSYDDDLVALLPSDFMYHSSIAGYLTGETDLEKKLELFSDDCFDKNAMKRDIASFKNKKTDPLPPFGLMTFLMMVE